MKGERSIGKMEITETVILVTHQRGTVITKEERLKLPSILLGIGSSKKGVEDDDGFI